MNEFVFRRPVFVRVNVPDHSHKAWPSIVQTMRETDTPDKTKLECIVAYTSCDFPSKAFPC
jgi:hypothetical protein